MRVLAVSDLHGSLEASRQVFLKARTVDIDVIVISGDITNFGSVQNAKTVLSPILKLKMPIFFVPGNCDPPSLAETDLEGAFCIHGSCETYDNIMFAGAGGGPISPFGTPFEMTEHEIMKVLNQSFGDKQSKTWMILVSHTPPKDTKLDVAFSGEHVGSSSLRKYIEGKRPSIVFCGHIHEARGIDRIGNTVIVNPGPARRRQCAVANISEKIEISLDHL